MMGIEREINKDNERETERKWKLNRLMEMNSKCGMTWTSRKISFIDQNKMK